MGDEEAPPPRVLNQAVHGCPEGAVFVGRPSKWGNPFKLRNRLDPYERESVIRRYRQWVCEQPALVKALPELRGKSLVCWCAPAPCHADVLFELANA